MMEKMQYCHVEYSDDKSFNYDHVRIPPSDQIGYHLQNGWELSYIIVGNGTRIIGNVTAPFTQGEVVLLPPNLPHVWCFDEDSVDEEGLIENISINFPVELIDKIQEGFPELKEALIKISTLDKAIAFKEPILLEIQNTM